jgi:hypothetical protein
MRIIALIIVTMLCAGNAMAQGNEEVSKTLEYRLDLRPSLPGHPDATTRHPTPMQPSTAGVQCQAETLLSDPPTIYSTCTEPNGKVVYTTTRNNEVVWKLVTSVDEIKRLAANEDDVRLEADESKVTPVICVEIPQGEPLRLHRYCMDQETGRFREERPVRSDF